MAAPHLGSRRPRRGATNAVFNALMPKMFSRTGGQLTLVDAATTETQALSSALSAVQNKKFFLGTDLVLLSMFITCVLGTYMRHLML